jgi:hypothetical protein
MRFELTTFTLANCEHHSETVETQGLNNAPPEACTNACTNSPESMHGEPVGDDFAEQVRAVMALPLTDAEKAEAVRRLLATKGTT